MRLAPDVEDDKPDDDDDDAAAAESDAFTVLATDLSILSYNVYLCFVIRGSG
jgi:hypothetical protein